MIESIIKAYERMKEVAAMPEGKIFIRGCGKNGYCLATELVDLGIPVHAFVDPVCEGASQMLDIPIITPAQLYEQLSSPVRDEIFIINSVKDECAWESIRQEMEDNGLTYMQHFADLGMEILLRRNSERIRLNRIKPLFNNGYELAEYKLNELESGWNGAGPELLDAWKNAPSGK